MTFLNKISLFQFKNYDQFSLDFNGKIVAITGNNGMGKTNLLDAIYYLCYTKSYFTNKEQNNMQFGKDAFRVDGYFTKNGESLHITCRYQNNKKTIINNKSEYEKITQHIGCIQSVMIAPDDINIINGTGELRRKHFDSILAQIDVDYFNHLMSYQKLIIQRNAYLKLSYSSNVDYNYLDVIDQQLIHHGIKIIEKRESLAQLLPDILPQFYFNLCNGSEKITVVYKFNVSSENLSKVFIQSRAKDLEARRTLVGPHLDDWEFLINDISLKNHGSQGQKKTTLISLKLTQIELLKKHQMAPILLLDDIFEKLDHQRLSKLFNLLNEYEFPQIFLTHTQKNEVKTLTSPYFKDIEIHEI